GAQGHRGQPRDRRPLRGDPRDGADGPASTQRRALVAAVIEARNLTKRFGGRMAIEDVSFEVEPGEVVGFLGPNGAGKTTTMRILRGTLRPDAGEAKLDLPAGYL